MRSGTCWCTCYNVMRMHVHAPWFYWTHTQSTGVAERQRAGRTDERAHVGSPCFLSRWHWGLKGTQRHWQNGRQQIWGKKMNGAGRLLFRRMMFQLRGFIVLRFPFRFFSLLVFVKWPWGLSVSLSESQNTGNLSLLSVLLTNAAWDLWDTMEIQCSWIYGISLCWK